ncbi:M16 family metallopeptidase [Nonomuraea angiospora]|uniref:M16 family metallopeptidase n=1 Tax=Nonomuraea angiospora TaxID=46172 RepID=UPI0037AA4042
MTGTSPPRPPLPKAQDGGLPAAHTTALDTGLRTTYIDLPGRDVAAVQLLFAGGGAHDPPELQGLSHVLAHTLILASATRGPAEFALAVEGTGATFTAGCDPDGAHVDVVAPATRLVPALRLLAEAVTRPALDARTIRQIVDRRLVEIRRTGADPHHRAVQLFAAAVHPGHGHGRPAGGTTESINRLRQQHLQEFYDHRIGPQHAHLIVAGDLSATRIRHQVEQAFGAWRKPSHPPPRLTPATAGAGRCLITHLPGAKQAALVLGRAGPVLPLGPRAGLEIAVHALGGWSGSRINQLLREERGHAYGVQGWLVSRPAAPGRHQCTLQLRAATANPDLGPTARELIDTAAAAAGGDLTPADLRSAADHLIGVQGVRWEAARHLSEAYAHLVRKGYPPGFLQRRAAAIAAIGTDRPAVDSDRPAIATAIATVDPRHLRPEHLTLAVAGDADIIHPALSAIGLAPEIVEGNPP